MPWPNEHEAAAHEHDDARATTRPLRGSHGERGTGASGAGAATASANANAARGEERGRRGRATGEPRHLDLPRRVRWNRPSGRNISTSAITR